MASALPTLPPSRYCSIRWRQGQVARSSCRSLDPMRFMSSDRRSTLSWATVVLATVGVFVVFAVGHADDGRRRVPLLRLRPMKVAVLGSSDHGEDARPTSHKVSVSSLVTTRFIGSKSILVCNGALPDLGMLAVCLIFRPCHGGGRGRRWTMFRRGTGFSKGGIIVLLLVGFFVQVFLTRMFVSCSDYMCNQ
jgi:hypothetical protein